MQCAAIVPVKRIGAAKQRLSAIADPADRADLITAMLGDVFAALDACKELDEVMVVTGEPAARELAGRAGYRVIEDPGDRGHSVAALEGISEAVRGDFDLAALLPGDCPLIDSSELGSALLATNVASVGVIPDRHGTGTNGLLLRPPDAIEPSFGPGSHERHLSLARAADLEATSVRLESLALDLDTDEDLELLARAVADDPDRAPRTAEALGRMAPIRRGEPAR